MEGSDKEHLHEYINNDEGFEVCVKCGVCSSQQVYDFHKYHCDDKPTKNSEFIDVLKNNHIGYEDEIELFYKELKFKLSRGYPNIALYAYATYCTLLQNFVFCTIEHIEGIFLVTNFKKIFCQIEKNECIKKTNFDLNLEEYSLSAIRIFLAEFNPLTLSGKAEKICQNIRKKAGYISVKPLVVTSLYLALFDHFTDEKQLKEHLSIHFSINRRTLKTVIKRYQCYSIF